MTLRMNKVNKKQDSNDKERGQPKFEPYKSLGLKYRFA